MDENFACQVQVFYEDTDAGGVVYHANYLRYCERARSLWLEAQGLTHGRLAAQYGIGFVVTHADVRFRAPARLDDRLQVTVSIERRRRASLLFAQSIRRGPEMLVSARITVASVDSSNFSPCALPALIRTAETSIGSKETE